MEIGKVWSRGMVRGSGECSMAPRVAECPGAGIAGRLLADEAVLDHQLVVGIGLLVEEVPELAVEALVLVVAHLEQSVLDAEGVAEVVAEIVLGDLRRPAGEVLAVEERRSSLPSAASGFAARRLCLRGQRCGEQEQLASAMRERCACSFLSCVGTEHGADESAGHFRAQDGTVVVFAQRLPSLAGVVDRKNNGRAVAADAQLERSGARRPSRYSTTCRSLPARRSRNSCNPPSTRRAPKKYQ